MGYHGMDMQQMPPSLSNLMSGMDGYGANMAGMGNGMTNMEGMQQNGHSWRPVTPGITVHTHVTDNPSSSPPVSSAQAAAKAAEMSRKQQAMHADKLRRLKLRLVKLKKGLSNLEEEQSKKSHNANSPAAKRKDAIKKLLIKNLKLAALIASKEIQLEEAKVNGEF